MGWPGNFAKDGLAQASRGPLRVVCTLFATLVIGDEVVTEVGVWNGLYGHGVCVWSEEGSDARRSGADLADKPLQLLGFGSCNRCASVTLAAWTPFIGLLMKPLSAHCVARVNLG